MNMIKRLISGKSIRRRSLERETAARARRAQGLVLVLGVPSLVCAHGVLLHVDALVALGIFEGLIAPVNAIAGR